MGNTLTQRFRQPPSVSTDSYLLSKINCPLLAVRHITEVSHSNPRLCFELSDLNQVLGKSVSNKKKDSDIHGYYCYFFVRHKSNNITPQQISLFVRNCYFMVACFTSSEFYRKHKTH